MMAFPTSAPRSIKIKVGEKQVLELKNAKKNLLENNRETISSKQRENSPQPFLHDLKPP
jgi:hypothetical protein